MQLKSKLIWIGIGVLSLVLRWLGSFQPEWIERIYSRGIFIFMRGLYDLLFGWLPFPMLYLFVPLVIIWLVKTIIKIGKSTPKWPLRIWYGAVTFVAFLSGLIFAFLLVWGYNYGKVSMEDQLGISPKPLDKNQIWEALQAETQELIALRASIPGAGEEALDQTNHPPRLERRLRQLLKSWLKENDFPSFGKARAYKIYPKGIFMHFSSSGLYFPFTGQGQVDAGLHPLQWPYVMTHEMGHAYGFGDEGTCNFLAYVACASSKDPVIAYMGRLAYWRTLATSYLRYEREAYQAFRETLPVGMQADLNAINENLRAYPDFMPKARYAAYDAYLKAQGIKEGMLNYSRVKMMEQAWKAKQAMN